MRDTFSLIKESGSAQQRSLSSSSDVCGWSCGSRCGRPVRGVEVGVKTWLRRYGNHGLKGLTNASNKTKLMAHHMPAPPEVGVLNGRRTQSGTTMEFERIASTRRFPSCDGNSRHV